MIWTPFNPYLLYNERTYQESNALKEKNSNIRGKRKNKVVAGVGFEPTTSGLLVQRVMKHHTQGLGRILSVAKTKYE